MAPNNSKASNHSDDLGLDCVEELVLAEGTAAPKTKKKASTPIVWLNSSILVSLHIAACYSLTLIPGAQMLTLLYTWIMYLVTMLGVTGGVHRLWSHRSYKARLPLRIFLGMCHTMAYQGTIYFWARDHRTLHKFSETDADPYNAQRGFFFSHIGWLMVKKHPEVLDKGKVVQVADLEKDPVVMFQRRHYGKLSLFFAFILPTIIPLWAWGETVTNAFFLGSILRIVLALNAALVVNSLAHRWGNKPYDERINPAENMFVSWYALGEGFHNYHHVYPQDYSTSEFGWRLNLTTAFLDAMAFIGQAYDLKTIPRDVVERRKFRTGRKSDY